MEQIVGVGDYAISSAPNDIIKTFSLATCVGVTLFYPEKKIFAMIHIALPDSRIEKRRLRFNPYKYADTGIKKLLEELFYKYGCCKLEKFIAGIYGGIDPKEGDVFKIGKRNIRAVERMLSVAGIRVFKRDVGGKFSRTLIGYVINGQVEVTKRKMNY